MLSRIFQRFYFILSEEWILKHYITEPFQLMIIDLITF